MRPIPSAVRLCLLALVASAAAVRHPVRDVLPGTWSGSAVYQGARLDFSLRLVRDGAALRASLTCPDMMLLEQPLDSVRCAGAHLHFVTLDERSLVFDGVASGDSLRGTATFPPTPGVVRPGGGAAPLRFALGRAAAPAPPPYRARELRIASGNARLAATLYTPAGAAAPVAGLVVLQGASANSRREDLFVADRFARAGLAVLVYDKRGRGGSTGDYAAATYEQLADDAAAAVNCLRREAGVDSQRVGIFGTGQGGFIGPLVAARVPALRFIVAVSAPGMPVGESAAYQDSVRLDAQGFDAADVVRAVDLDRRLTDWLRTGKDGDEMGALLGEAASTTWRRASSLPVRLPSGAALEGWYWRGRTLDPAPWWRAVHVPVLAVFGAADERAPARPGARLIERALHQAGNHDALVRMFPNANHALRTMPLVSGGPWDWPRAAPGYLDLVTGWVLAHD